MSEPDVQCDTNTCGYNAEVPNTVTVAVSFDFYDRVFQTYLGPRGVAIEANVTMNYVGR